MIKKTFTYEDLDGNQAVDQYYFALSKSELRDLQFEYHKNYSGFFGMLKDVREQTSENEEDAESKFPTNTDAKLHMYNFIRDLLIRSAGVRSEDGRKIEKGPAIREKFIGSYAYEELLEAFCNSEEAFISFLKGVVPSDVAGSITMRAFTDSSPATNA